MRRISTAHMMQKTYQIRNKPPGTGGPGLYQENGCCIASRAAKRFCTLGCARSGQKRGARKAVSGSGRGGYQSLLVPRLCLGTHFLEALPPVCVTPGEAEPRGRGFPGRSLGTRGNPHPSPLPEGEGIGAARESGNGLIHRFISRKAFPGRGLCAAGKLKKERESCESSSGFGGYQLCQLRP